MHINAPRICTVVIHWNQEEFTRECISSLYKINYPNIEIILVDNGSTDGSGKRITKDFEEIVFIRSTQNLGYAGGANLGLETSLKHGSDYAFLINNDIVLESEILKHFLAVMQNDTEKKIGICVPKMYYCDNPDTIWYAGGELDTKTGLCNHLGYGQKDNPHNSTLRECTFVNGCGMFIRREVIEKVGLFDTEYYHTGEDADYSIRATQAGFKLMFVPQAKLWHKIRASAGSIVNPTYFYLYYEYRNRLIIFRKYFKNNLNLPTINILLKFYLRSIFNQVKLKNLKGAIAIFHGILHAILGKTGKSI